jgi:hypothetical protein
MLYPEYHGATEVLVLRNAYGRKLAIANTADEKKELRRRYERYNKTTRTQDLPASPRLRRKIASRIAFLKKQGFTYSLMLYRVRMEKKTSKPEYQRIEFFKATRWTRHEVKTLWLFFNDNIPKDNIVLCVLRGKKLFKVRLNSPN